MRVQGRKWYRIENAAADEAEVLIYDAIAFFGVSAQDLVQDLGKITARTINLRINSPGGNVFDGIAIYNALIRHPARVISHVDGLAASIASVIALAGDEVHMAQGSFFMIHNATAVAGGDARELRRVADLVDRANGSLVDIYVKRTSQTEKQVRAWMDDEKWMDAEEARAAGFATSVDENQKAMAAAFDVGMFRHVPEQVAALLSQAKPVETIRDFETFLRDEGGFSHAAAKAIAAGGFKPGAEPRDEDDGLQELVAALNVRGRAFASN